MKISDQCTVEVNKMHQMVGTNRKRTEIWTENTIIPLCNFMWDSSPVSFTTVVLPFQKGGNRDGEVFRENQRPPKEEMKPDYDYYACKAEIDEGYVDLWSPECCGKSKETPSVPNACWHRNSCESHRWQVQSNKIIIKLRKISGATHLHVFKNPTKKSHEITIHVELLNMRHHFFLRVFKT